MTDHDEVYKTGDTLASPPERASPAKPVSGSRVKARAMNPAGHLRAILFHVFNKLFMVVTATCSFRTKTNVISPLNIILRLDLKYYKHACIVTFLQLHNLMIVHCV